MASELVISGVTFTSAISKALPTIPGLLSLGFFGSGFDGINTNRASGGPPFANLVNAPITQAAYKTIGTQNTYATATATISGGAVTGFTGLVGGAGYVTAPSVKLIGGGGSGATVNATISGGVVTGFTGLVGGSGYTTAPGVFISGGNSSSIDTGVTRASVLAGGWSVGAVCRVPASGAESVILGDTNSTVNSAGFPFKVGMQNANGFHSSLPTLEAVGSAASRDDLLIMLPSSATNWRFVALTYSGGATGTFNLYSLSDGLTATPFVAASISAAASQQIHLGNNALFEGNSSAAFGAADLAFSMVASGALSLLALQGIYASVKSILARRSIAVL